MKKKLHKKNNKANIFSIFALIISLLSIYFSVFYKNHDLTISIIDSKIEYLNNSINVDLLLHNRGNSYSTVIGEYLTFYQDADWENEGVIFNDGKAVYSVPNNPIILKPNEQILKNISTIANFKNIYPEYQIKLNFQEKINIGLVVTYINSSGLKTRDLFKIGYVNLDNNKTFEKSKINYNNYKLNSWSYYSSTGND